MPIKPCESDGKPGYKFGDAGHCYPYTPGDESSRRRAHDKAQKQGAAEHARSLQVADDLADSAMVCLIPPPEIAQQLAMVDGEPPERLHVTLVYLGPTTNLDRGAVEDAIHELLSAILSIGDMDEDDQGQSGVTDPDEDGDADSGTLRGIFNGTARFGADDRGIGIPVVYTLDAPGIGPLVTALGAGLRDSIDGLPEPNHGIMPHMTIAYRIDADPEAPMELPPPPMTEVTFSSVVLAFGPVEDPANVTVFPLSGAASLTAAAEPTDYEALRARLMESGAGAWESCALVEGKWTDDGRMIQQLWSRTPPLSLQATDKTTENHDDAEQCGVIMNVWREGDSILSWGFYKGNEAGLTLRTGIDAGDGPLWPSVDLAPPEEQDLVYDQDGRVTVLDGLMVAETLVPMPAQEGTWFRSLPDEQIMSMPLPGSDPGAEVFPRPPRLDAEGPMASKEEMMAKRATKPRRETAALGPVVACADERRAGGPLQIPPEWLADPHLEAVTPHTVTAEGQVFGHLAGPGCHIGRPDTCIRVRDEMLSRDFSIFHKGVDGAGHGILLADGSRLGVGQITLRGGHADTNLNATAAGKEYDDTDSVIAYIRAGWDERNGLPWYAGAVRYGTSQKDVQTLRASGLSVDYRAIGKTLHLIAVAAVPVPGFPTVPASFAASGERARPRELWSAEALVAGGHIQTLIAHTPSKLEALTVAFQQGNPEGMLDWYCNDAGIDWGSDGDFDDCVSIASAHLDDPNAFCNFMHERCAGSAPGAEKHGIRLDRKSFAEATGTPYQPATYEADPDETVLCPTCGKMNSPDAVFCDQDGTRLEGRTDVAVVAPKGPPEAPTVPAMASKRRRFQQAPPIPPMDGTDGAGMPPDPEEDGGPVPADMDLPIADIHTAWDPSAATGRIAQLCQVGEGTVDPDCYGRGFFYCDPTADPTTAGAYSLPFADVIAGELYAVADGVQEAASTAQKGNGISTDDLPAVKEAIGDYYDTINSANPDQAPLEPPWGDEEENPAMAPAPDMVAGGDLTLMLAKDFLTHQLREEAALLASAHEQERDALVGNLR